VFHAYVAASKSAGSRSSGRAAQSERLLGPASKIFGWGDVDYDPFTGGTEYVPQWIKLEFGPRSTGEPAES